MSKCIEVFTSGSTLCEDVVNQVRSLACPKCEVVVYDLNRENNSSEIETKSKAYGIQSIPAVVIDGKIIDLSKLKGRN